MAGNLFSFFQSGSHLLSHAVSSIVSSAVYVLTIVFGMRTGVSHKRIATRSLLFLMFFLPAYFNIFSFILQAVFFPLITQ